ncbi:MAG: alpha/beta fold hydrolase [Alteromonadaceae bacterium]|nr:alpha/beta fold hydrolase [Alteromonadaceae bacterium]
MKILIGSGSGHIDTLFPVLLRKKFNIDYERERIDTPDGDFLDLDWVKKGSKNLVLLSHGFEGSSKGQYIKGMIKNLSTKDTDFLCWNFRGCSGEINRSEKFYHSGLTDDFEQVINHTLKTNEYKSIFLVSFSMGGNLNLKYLGEKSNNIPREIKKAIAFSVPLDLHDASVTINTGFNKYIYSKNFLKTILPKVEEKREVLEKVGIDVNRILRSKVVLEIDEHLTAPLYGFKSAVDYYDTQSCINFLDGISIPTKIINAKNDPFLGKKCYPSNISEINSNIEFLTPKHGGHVGFHHLYNLDELWSEKITKNFLFD